jgi:hypothetical protein
MIYVSTPRHGYRFIFSQEDTSIALFQLMVNVVFAALIGTLVANLPRRGFYWLAAFLTLAAVAAGIVAIMQIREASIVQAQRSAAACAYSDEQYADRLLQYSQFQSPLQQQNVKKAKLYLLHAAENWHIAGNIAEEQRVRAREKKVVVIDFSRLSDQPKERTLNPSDFPDQPQEPR